MSDTSGFTQAYTQATEAFTKFVPGFDFLEGLVKNAGKALPSMGQWIAPTLDPAELDRRIEELKTVQFWLEQNARMLGATIQALEVQRMTLGTLKGMNVSLTDLGEALKVRVPDMFNAAPAAPDSSANPNANWPGKAAPAPSPAPAAEAAAAATAGMGAIDPMQWWGSLTEQFTQLAAQTLQASSEAARQASEATSDAASQASEAVKAATAAATEAAQAAATNAVNAASTAASTAATHVASAAPAAKAAKKATKAAAPAPAKPARPRAARKAAGTAADAPAAPKAVRRRAS